MDLPGGGGADLTMVSLGHVDIDPQVLTGEGGSLREAIGGRPLDDRIGEIAERLPRAGWRLIHRSPAQGDWGGSEVFAALCGETADSGWAVATVSAPGGGGDWILSADPGPVSVFPGRAARRAALSLSWPDDLSATAGSIPELSIRLRNETDRVWSNDRGDMAYVAGWLLDADGRRLEESSWFAFGVGDTLPTLQPGEMVTLPVAMASFDYQSLSPGNYQLDAMVVALDLCSAAGSIVLM